MIRSSCSIIVPVKPIGIGKSRLRAALAASDDGMSALVASDDGTADDVVAAIALDTIAAALATGAHVLVVTDDPAITRAATGLGAQVTPDAPDAGLNAAITYGESLLPAQSIRASLTADLPAMRAAELAAALDASAGRRAYLADHLGTGTTLLIAPPGVPLDPHFGPDSAAAHAASGALALGGDWPSARLDVDTRDDLDAADRLGLGPRTAAVLAARAGRRLTDKRLTDRVPDVA